MVVDEMADIRRLGSSAHVVCLGTVARLRYSWEMGGMHQLSRRRRQRRAVGFAFRDRLLIVKERDQRKSNEE